MMAFEQDPQTGMWAPGPGYYDRIAESQVNSTLHLIGRLGVAVPTFVQQGCPIIEVAPGFEAAQAELAAGNIIIASTHRSGWETIRQPARFEEVGLHHARPVNKVENMQNVFGRWIMHGLGSIAVDRNNADQAGLLRANSGILQRGGILTFYPGGTRKYKDVIEAEVVHSGIIFTAVHNDSRIVPTAAAGMSREKRGNGEDRHTVARDKKSPFGLGPKLVYTFGAPFRLEKPGFVLEANMRKLTKVERAQQIDYLRESGRVIQERMQNMLSWAYAIRGSSLEKRTPEYIEELRALYNAE
jgi:1-acyl-sn-glycerol-3-phosphate acyltransferase